MKIAPTIKVFLIILLVLVMIVSYLIKKSNGQTEITPPLNNLTTGQETVDEYNKRKKKEIIQRTIKEQKVLKNKKDENNTEYGRKLTINGYDPAVGDIIDPINLWENYETRTYAGKVRHGEIVTLIRREGDGVFIEKKSGLRGWVTYFFIKEFSKE